MTDGSMGLREVSPEVFQAEGPVVRVGPEEIEFLRARLPATERGRVRLCAHGDSGDSLHEMLILLRRDSYVRPHRHPGKSESFHVVEGLVDVVLFTADGEVSDVVELGDPASGRRFYYRLAAPLYHTLVIRSEVLVVHETTNGPFRREDTEFAPWAPEEGDRDDERSFMEEVARRAGAFLSRNRQWKDEMSTVVRHPEGHGDARAGSRSVKRDRCRLCEGRELELVFPIKPTPIADAYVPAERLAEEQERFPLDLYLCRECGHVQLLDVVDPEVLFGNYIYFTSISKGLVEHFRVYAGEIVERAGAPEGSLVIDVGSNDGSLLRFFQDRGMRVLGIDPARNIAEKATREGIETIPAFFTPEVARDVRARYGPAKIVTANNVFAHADDLGGMAEGVRILLDGDGIFVFEVSYLVDIIDRTLFDTVYHEHLCYHSVAPLVSFFASHGMELIDVERLPNKGGSIRGTVQLSGGPRPVGPAVGELLALERERGLASPEVFREYAERVDAVRRELHALLDRIDAEGKTVAGFGASATVTTLIYHFDLGERLPYLVDDNAMRHGLYSPGHHIPVLSPQALYERKPDYVVILAWQYAEPIMRNHRAFLEQGGRFVVPLPEVRVVPAEDAAHTVAEA